MRLIHTMAKKARRASGFHAQAGHGGQSANREDKRDYLHKDIPKTFGEQVVRIQRTFKGCDQFGNPRYKFIKHGVSGKQ